jgi:hypothetical protein
MTPQALENQEAGPVPAEQGIAVGASMPLMAAEQLNPEWLIAKAIEQKLPVRSLEQLLAMRERLKTERAREAFYRALSGFQSECPVIPKSKTATVTSRRTGASYQYLFASLDVIVAAVRPCFQKHGFSYRIDTHVEPGTPAFLVATCMVHHREGHSESSEFRVPVETSGRMNPAQEYGSAGTYAKRYAFCNAFGILTGDEDDDGQSLGAPRDEPPPPEIRVQGPGVVQGARITPAQHRLLEARIGQLDLDRERVKDWLKRASKGRIEHLDDLPAELFDRLLAKLDEWGTPVKYRPVLGGEDQPVAIQTVLVSSGGTPFEEVLRLAKLARAEEDREMVLDLARELPEDQRGEVERVLRAGGD